MRHATDAKRYLLKDLSGVEHRPVHFTALKISEIVGAHQNNIEMNVRITQQGELEPYGKISRRPLAVAEEVAGDGEAPR